MLSSCCDGSFCCCNDSWDGVDLSDWGTLCRTTLFCGCKAIGPIVSGSVIQRDSSEGHIRRRGAGGCQLAQSIIRNCE